MFVVGLQKTNTSGKISPNSVNFVLTEVYKGTALMSSDNFSGSTKIPVIRAKVWVELDNRLIMSDYLATLLKNIDRTQSLKSAAASMKLPYRTALKKINEIEAAVESPLVKSVSGGSTGGSSKLTPYAKELLKKFDAVQQRIADLEGQKL